MGTQPLRIVFMGTPQFAATILEKLVADDSVEVVAVYTQPDRPAGRGKKLKASEVKELALARGITVHQPVHFKDAADIATLTSYAPDFLVVAAYGIILPQAVLDIPLQMPINVHGSLLPKYRGAAPIQRAIMQGEVVTGVTIMRMEAGLDTGPMLMQQAMGIDINETASQLHDELSAAGADLLLETLQRLQQGKIRQLAQDDALSTYAARLTKQEGAVDFSQKCSAVHAHIRGVTEWPGAHATLEREGQEALTIGLRPGIYPFSAPFEAGTPPGTIGGVEDDRLLVACADGWYAFTLLRPAGKKNMDGKAFHNGYVAQHPAARFR